ncbi:menaquinone-dependent protoporphyrinogen IX dehydrogenase [Shewanella fodinae]|uniref:menaquinone-dependent protoporphyrinogen IX dehydrogenase n=1 Tax=Shewanella fodinae TaxID=552357 RepID=UPI00167B3193|nr:menaquinone-dependent protoporphyrinogen IX dehydrogenase [Shewanella fodinae]MCL2907425.1 menaquinone-dependent protoporphyrinogen IX dehydrogenase [Shewanella fodinae]GGZ08302.1 oxygen-independent protoporphyrinogen oxidase HemG [Shewanella fodinae]
MNKTLILFSSVHGQTRKICEFMAKRLQQQGQDVTMSTISEAPELGEFDRILIGASIRHGKHNPAVYDFIRQHQALLDTKPNGFFSVSLVARKPAKNTPETNPYMQAFLAKSGWRPKLLAVFGGNLNYQGYDAMDRNIIRFIMWITKGPTDPNTCVEYTDWQKVAAFTDKFATAA